MPPGIIGPRGRRAQANVAHGQRRTNEDKRRAVLKLTGVPGWGWADKSDNELGVSIRAPA